MRETSSAGSITAKDCHSRRSIVHCWWRSTIRWQFERQRLIFFQFFRFELIVDNSEMDVRWVNSPIVDGKWIFPKYSLIWFIKLATLSEKKPNIVFQSRIQSKFRCVTHLRAFFDFRNYWRPPVDSIRLDFEKGRKVMKNGKSWVFQLFSQLQHFIPL